MQSDPRAPPEFLRGPGRPSWARVQESKRGGACTTGTHLSDAPVVPLGSLFLGTLPGGQLLGAGEGDAINALQGLSGGVSLPGGGRVLQRKKRVDGTFEGAPGGCASLARGLPVPLASSAAQRAPDLPTRHGFPPPPVPHSPASIGETTIPIILLQDRESHSRQEATQFAEGKGESPASLQPPGVALE